MNFETESEFRADAEETVAKTLEETDKKCTACGGTMNFDPASGMLVCPYCGNTQAIEQDPDERAEELSFFDAEERGNCDWGTDKKTVVCVNCGAETVYDALQTAGECPYCGSNQVMEANDKNTLAPGGVCPFGIDQKRADDAFRLWLKKRWFCPNDLKKNAGRVHFKGIYLPYWTFDSMTNSTYTARYGVTRTVWVGSGKNRRMQTRIDWYSTQGAYERFFNDCLVKGSTRHNAAFLSKIEPYNTEANVAYRPEYLSGFAAERYSVGLNDAWERAKNTMADKLESEVHNEVSRRHATVHVKNVRVYTVHHNITYKYLLLPVWMSQFEYRGKSYPFMINGQTGKVGGNAPISPWRVLFAILAGCGAAALLFILYYFLGM